ncbi:hypothetical protein [uncultured Microscilla sp.]|uniref:hypothetical protein n=1 Tax=uncultured Microscilla sp. TaxID=432653 RepID=UPI002619AF23|nr:hypothetical protein [uncultured Microscilla sp.]
MNNTLVEMAIQRLKKLGLEYQPLPWHYDTNIQPQDLEDYCFYKQKPIITDKVAVKLDKIVGTTHPGYHSQTWIETLGSLKKSNYGERQAAYEIIYNKHGKASQPKILHKYGDKYFIFEGNNRITTAKFLGIEELEFDYIQEYKLNDALLKAYNKLTELGLNPETRFEKVPYNTRRTPIRFNGLHKGTPIWRITLNDKRLYIETFELIRDFIKQFENINIGVKQKVKYHIKQFGYKIFAGKALKGLPNNSDLFTVNKDQVYYDIYHHKLKMHQSKFDNK